MREQPGQSRRPGSDGPLDHLNSQRGQTLPSFRIPELDGLLAVFAAGDHQTFGGMPVDTLDISTVSCARAYTHMVIIDYLSDDGGVDGDF